MSKRQKKFKDCGAEMETTYGHKYKFDTGLKIDCNLVGKVFGLRQGFNIEASVLLF